MPTIKKTKKERISEKVVFLENLGRQYAKKHKNSPTKWESLFFKYLSDLHYPFKTQIPVIVNKTKSPQLYILDFVLTEHNLIIEIDGKQHFTKENLKKDNRRTKLLKQQGYSMLRFSNRQVSTFTKEQIKDIIESKISMLTNVK